MTDTELSGPSSFGAPVSYDIVLIKIQSLRAGSRKRFLTSTVKLGSTVWRSSRGVRDGAWDGAWDGGRTSTTPESAGAMPAHSCSVVSDHRKGQPG